MNYCYRVDKLFRPMYAHRTLRTIFDPDASEWDNTSIEKKVEILEVILQSGYPLSCWINDYLGYYKALKKSYVESSLPRALEILKENSLNQNLIHQIDDWLRQRTQA